MTSQPAPTRRATADFLNHTVRDMPPSGIRRFFDMLAEMKDVISLTIGEPDFTTPAAITLAAIASLEAGETHYTANGGMIELRELIAANLADRYGVEYDARTELVITVGASEGVDAARWIHGYLYSRSASIYGGSSEIQRGIIAQRMLELPRA